MTIEAVIALATLAVQTVQQMIANGQATTTAEQTAALLAANNAADAADAAANQPPTA